MSRALQAALLSGLVFPGTGHLLLKKYARGWMFIILSTLALIFLFKGAWHQAHAILQNIEASGGGLDVANISALLQQQTEAGSDIAAIGIAAWGFLVVWLLGILDAYRLGKKFPAKLH